MKKYISQAIYGLLLSGIGFIILMSGLNNEPSIVLIAFLFIVFITLPICLLIHTCYLISKDRLRYTPHLIFWSTYVVAIFSSTLILMIWIITRV